jgi:PIN domain nuclease of toxin-antitoxin system
MSNRIVLDTFAVLAFLEGEPSGQRVADILTTGDPWMTLVNLGEVTYIVERSRGKTAADVVFADLLADERSDGGVPIHLLPVDQTLVRRAASLKAAGGLSYADCFAAAAAWILECPVLTGDPEFVAAERAGIEVTWL